MEKKELMMSLLVISFLVMGLLISAEENTSEATNNSDSGITVDSGEESKIDDAYNCVKEKTNSCEGLSTHEKIFSVMSTGRCQNELINEMTNDNCWGVSSNTCDVKTTSQAILALRTAGVSVSDSEDWLIQQNSTPEEIDWFLQVESKEATTCSVSYGSESGNFDIKEDKTITSGAGSCFSLARDSYWLKVSPNCYSEEFKISCDKSFQTNLLFKKQNSNIFHVSEDTKTASAEGETVSNVNSFCFSNSGSDCDYGSSLWSSFVLYDSHDVSPFVPYLVTMSENNLDFLPESFLYYITANDEFKNEIFKKQKDSRYWDFSGDKFYDTAVALIPFQYGNPVIKKNAKQWLLEPGVQGDDGCWNNLADTGFLLSMIWPRQFSSSQSSDTQIDCEDSGYYCLSELECNGEILDSYSCGGAFVCCSEPQKQLTCNEENGKICSSNEKCNGQEIFDVKGLNTGETCCDGDCEPIAQITLCEENNGGCYSSCTDNEEELEEYSESCPAGDICCITKKSDDEEGFGWFWIILLLVLIVLVILGIIYRDKLRPYWFKIKSKFSRGDSTNNNGSGPGKRGSPGNIPRRQLPQQGNMPQRNNRRNMSGGDLDSTLQRLKDKSQ